MSNTRIHNTVNITNLYNTTYVNNTVVQNRVVNQRFVNMAAPNAVTIMPHDAFAGGRSVSQAGMPLRGNDLERIRSAPAVVGPGITPTRQALAPVRGSGPVAQPPARVTNTRVVVRTPPPSPQASPSGFRRQAETPAVRVAPPARQMPDQPRRVEPVDRPRPTRDPHAAPPERREGFSRPQEQQPQPRIERPPAPHVEPRPEPRIEPQRRPEPQAAPVRQEHHEAKPAAKREDKKGKDK
ncbi:MAG: hypothetical protein ABSE56_09015 [Bryobacteraceae bacterium]